ncbi:hypothetical protein Naga_100037g7 [Nannochloropsis gaditana]|uniref:Uncharacterized protein n=1 Tax=Nannochloropsis gaditana TaxID=72520 RepID=W7THR2_9STRA|nr:hypothetical protein Naga_100037g7 [Nannochloropsis gaditana]
MQSVEQYTRRDLQDYWCSLTAQEDEGSERTQQIKRRRFLQGERCLSPADLPATACPDPSYHDICSSVSEYDYCLHHLSHRAMHGKGQDRRQEDQDRLLQAV